MSVILDKPIKWFIPPPNDDGTPRQLKTCSISRLHKFESCRRRAALEGIFKIPEPEREHTGESPLDRGTRHHKLIEEFILGSTLELSTDIKKHRSVIESLAAYNKEYPELVQTEEMWTFTDDWTVCKNNDWARIWFIVKLDLFALYVASDTPDIARVIDWKTGKKKGNEIKHRDQLIAYAISALLRFPDLEQIEATLYYTDVGETTRILIDRLDCLKLFGALNRRLQHITNALEFPPRPSLHHCRFCPYKTGAIDDHTEGTGHCDLNPN